jgi:hypothetical protein
MGKDDGFLSAKRTWVVGVVVGIVLANGRLIIELTFE